MCSIDIHHSTQMKMKHRARRLSREIPSRKGNKPNHSCVYVFESKHQFTSSPSKRLLLSMLRLFLGPAAGGKLSMGPSEILTPKNSSAYQIVTPHLQATGIVLRAFVTGSLHSTVHEYQDLPTRRRHLSRLSVLLI